MPEDLHIPAKFDKLRAETLVRRVADHNMRRQDWAREDFIRTTAEVLRKLGEGDRQNWLEIERWASRTSSAASPFNATIDASQPSNAGLHRYKNVTELLASETWLSTELFVAGVHATSTAITETGSMTLPGPFALIAFGATNNGTAGWPVFTGSNRQKWDLNGNQVRVTSGNYNVYLKLIHLLNTGSLVLQAFIQSG